MPVWPQCLGDVAARPQTPPSAAGSPSLIGCNSLNVCGLQQAMRLAPVAARQLPYRHAHPGDAAVRELAVGLSFPLIVAAVWLMTRPPASEPNLSPVARNLDPWRRTANGWEQLSEFSPVPRPVAPSLHPTTVAAAELLLSMLGLVALSPTAIAGGCQRHSAAVARPSRELASGEFRRNRL
jgi:hypothetical protein